MIADIAILLMFLVISALVVTFCVITLGWMATIVIVLIAIVMGIIIGLITPI